MAATDAGPVPVKNQAYRVSFPILDADGDLVTGATGLDSEVSKDGGTFVDCASEATEIATASGMYFLDLTAAEMNADTVCVIVKTTSSGAKTTPMVMYPNKTGGLSVNVTSWAGTATATTNVALKNTLAKTTDITGFNDLSAAQVNAEADTALVDVGLTTTVTGRIDAAVSTRSTPAQVQAELVTYNAAKPGAAMTLTSAYDAAKTAATQTSVNTIDGRLDTEIPAIKAVTDKLDTAMELDVAVYRFTTNALEQAPTGSGSSPDPWSVPLPGSYVAGTAGNILGSRLDVAVSTRSTYAGADTAGTTTLLTRIPSALSITGGKVDVNDKTGFSLVAAYDPAKTAAQPGNAMTLTAAYDSAKTAAQVGSPMTLTVAYDAAKTAATQTSVDLVYSVVDTEVGAIKAKTDQMVFTGGKIDANASFTLSASDFNSIADAVLKRDWTLISGEAAYSLLNAARMLRDKWNTTAATLTVYKEDGSTVAWTRTLTTDPAAQPIIGAT
jgi:hypothetical protein